MERERQRSDRVGEGVRPERLGSGGVGRQIKAIRRNCGRAAFCSSRVRGKGAGGKGNRKRAAGMEGKEAINQACPGARVVSLAGRCG